MIVEKKINRGQELGSTEHPEKYREEGQPVSVEESTYLRRAATLERRGQYDRAIANVRKALEIGQRKASTYARLAVLCRAARRFDEALDALRIAAECEPSDPEIREMLLQICIESGKYKDAIVEGQILLKKWPKNLYARDVLSIAYLHQGEYNQALRITDELIFLDPLDPMNHFKKAIIFQQKGEIGAAMIEYARVLKLDPDCDLAQDAQDAMASLDNYQLRQIIALAMEDSLFRAKLMRDPENAAAERGFVLSQEGFQALKQLDYDSMSGTEGPFGGGYVYN